jgi:hypothetical protein
MQQNDKAEDMAVDEEEDIYTYEDEKGPVKEKGDWVGVERDRRSAFLIMGGLRAEGIL